MLTFPTLSPDASVVIFTAGVALIGVEMNRPGLVLPGAVGLLGVLLAMASWAQPALNPAAVGLLVAGLAVGAWELRHRLHAVWVIFSAGFWSLGFRFLHSAASPDHVRWIVAVPCGVVLGVGCSLLARMAQRAWRNKGVN